MLLEPTSVVAKAWEHIERIGARAPFWQPRAVLVTGAGPVGLLAALIGVQRGFEVHVLDRAKDGPKPKLVRDLGATYHAGDLDGSLDAGHRHRMHRRRPGHRRCHGAHRAGRHRLPRRRLRRRPRRLQFDVGKFNRGMVLTNDVVFGSVNANRRHYEMPPRRWPRPIRAGSPA